MEISAAINALSALAHDSRLSVFRLLVEAGPEGMPAGAVAERLAVPPATLSFHLAHLARAGLVRSRRSGRSIIYSADFGAMNRLIAYLTENCCRGSAATARPACLPAAAQSLACQEPEGDSDEAPARARRG
jgi:DNA-binding transcriptional ArsR family regulator